MRWLPLCRPRGSRPVATGYCIVLTCCCCRFAKHPDTKWHNKLQQAELRELQLDDDVVSNLASQDYSVMQRLLICIEKFLACIFRISTTHHDVLGPAASFSPFCEIVTRVTMPHGSDPTGRSPHIETILFDLVRNSADGVKIGAIRCLSYMRSSAFDERATEQMVSRLYLHGL